MKTLLLGHRGYLGSYLHKYTDWDIDTGQSYEHYDLIINCIAKSDMLWCENNPESSYLSNTFIPLNLKYLDSKIIHFSTYYVYDTGRNVQADEGSPLAKNSLQYIKHKIEGEDIGPNNLVLRVGKLFGNPDRKQGKLTDHILEAPSLELDQVWFNPCSCKCILKVLQDSEFIQNATGIFNLANDGLTTHLEYAKFILKEKNLEKDIKIVTRQPFPNYGRFAMDLTKIKNHIKLDHWQNDMREYLCSV